jgi:intracellular septation protein A
MTMTGNDARLLSKGTIATMAAKKHWFPFTAEQSVNILSEFGPLVTMFIVNAAGGIKAGTWALIISSAIAMIVMRLVIGRLPIFPIIASTITIVFGALTIVTGDPIWVKIKVSIFNAMFAGFLFGGLWATSPVMGRMSWQAVVAVTAAVLLAQIPYLEFSQGLMQDMPPMGDEDNPLTTNLFCLSTLVIGFVLGGFVFKRNFFSYVFEKTFHFTQEGWDRFTFSFAWFFVFTAVLNEAVRQIFVDSRTYPVLGYELDGTNVWILFKVALIMPLSGLYCWFLTRLMHKYRIEEPAAPHLKAPEAVSAAVSQGRGPSR